MECCRVRMCGCARTCVLVCACACAVRSVLRDEKRTGPLWCSCCSWPSLGAREGARARPPECCRLVLPDPEARAQAQASSRTVSSDSAFLFMYRKRTFLLRLRGAWLLVVTLGCRAGLGSVARVTAAPYSLSGVAQQERHGWARGLPFVSQLPHECTAKTAVHQRL